MWDTSGQSPPSHAQRGLMLELRRRRQEAELSQTELANTVGYSREYVSRAERPISGLPSAELIPT